MTTIPHTRHAAGRPDPSPPVTGLMFGLGISLALWAMIGAAVIVVT